MLNMLNGHKPHTLEYFPFYSFSKGSFIHYTCNSPSVDVLKKNGIGILGGSFGCVNDTEVLEIPLSLYKKKGFNGEIGNLDKNTLTLNLERLMRDLK